MTGFYLPYASFLQGIAGSGAGELEAGDVEFFIEDSLDATLVPRTRLTARLACDTD